MIFFLIFLKATNITQDKKCSGTDLEQKAFVSYARSILKCFANLTAYVFIQFVSLIRKKLRKNVMSIGPVFNLNFLLYL